MRVLFLTCHLPYPPLSGGRLREHELLRRVAEDVDVHVCAVSKTFAADARAAATTRTRKLCRHATVFAAAGAPARSSRTKAAQVAGHASAAATAFIRDVLENGWFDLVHVEGFYLAQHLPRDCSVPVLLAEQNVEFELWRQRVDHARDDERRRDAFLQYRLTREAELRAWREATACAAITAEDRSTMLRVAPELDVSLVPDGVDHLPLPSGADEIDANTIVLAGNFAYQPTMDAALWFCAEILPLVEARVPDVRLLLVGTDPPREVKALERRNVQVTGRVPRIEPYLDRAAVVVCPLRIGGGVKVKVLEALRRGKATVTTSIGAQGLGEGACDALRIADEADVFAANVVELLRRPRARAGLARSARSFASTLPSWDEAAAALLQRYAEVAGVPSASASLARDATPSLR